MRKFSYQNKKKKNYFEGWYFRFTNEVNYAIIFALTKNEEDPHAFIQLFNDQMDEGIYKRFDLSEFSYENEIVRIGDNHLSLNDVYVDIDGTKIKLKFTSSSQMTDSAMGYLSNAPLDCFQEVILIDGKAKGKINDVKTKGRIYIEKTYGNKFPKKWLWLQSNHAKNDSKISFSVGYIPFLRKTVKGWLLVIYYNHNRINFHSLDGSKLQYVDDGFIIKSIHYKVIVKYKKGETINLVGPGKNAKMFIPVYESLTSTASIEIYRKRKLIFEDTYENVGLEVMM